MKHISYMITQSLFSLHSWRWVGLLSLCLLFASQFLFGQSAPYDASTYITGVAFGAKNSAGIANNTDNFWMGWTKDDKQYFTGGDGYGFSGGTKYSIGFYILTGSLTGYSAVDKYEGNSDPGGKAHSVYVMGDGTTYMMQGKDGSGANSMKRNQFWKSTNAMGSWSMQWEITNSEYTPDFPRPHSPSAIQFGKGNTGTRDQYMYVLAPETYNTNWLMQFPGNISLWRCDTSNVDTKSSWKFYSGLDGNGDPTWTSNINDRAYVWSDVPNGVMRISCNYDASLGIYFLLVQQVARRTTEGTPYIGIYEASEPWGPWKTVLFEPAFNNFMNGTGTIKHVGYIMSNKWSSEYGDSSNKVIVFTGDDDFRTVKIDLTIEGVGPPPPPPPPALVHIWKILEVEGSPDPADTTPPANMDSIHVEGTVDNGVKDSLSFRLDGLAIDAEQHWVGVDRLADGNPSMDGSDLYNFILARGDTAQRFIWVAAIQDADSFIVGGRSRDGSGNFNSGVFDTVGVDTTGTPALSGSSPLADLVHPRLVFVDTNGVYTNSKEISAIEDYITANESANFQTWINTLDAAYNDGTGGKGKALLLADAMSYAFLSYAVHSGEFGGFSFSYTAQQYADEAVDQADQIRSDNPYSSGHDEDNITKDSEGWNASFALALVYDWCFDYITTGEKQAIANELISIYNWAWASGEWDISNSDHSVDEFAGSTWLFICLPGLTFSGDGLGTSYETKAQASLDNIDWYFKDRQLKNINLIYEGRFGYGGGVSYTGNLVARMPWFLSCYNSALNTDVANEFPLLADIPSYYRYKIEPEYNYQPEGGWAQGYWFEKSEVGTFGKVAKQKTAMVFKGMGFLLRQSYPDTAGYCKYLVESSRFSPIPFDNDQRRVWLFYKFIFGWEDLTQKTDAQANIALSDRIGEGRTWMLSDLTTDNATKIAFISTEFNAVGRGTAHAHKDNAGITIFKNGTLWVDAGHNKSGRLPRVGGWHKQFIAHNVVGLYNSGVNVEFQLEPNTQRNTMYYLHAANQQGGRNHVGNLVAIDLAKDNGDKYDFVDYDWTRFQKGNGIADSLYRKVLFIRDPNVPSYTNDEWFLVYDNISVNDSDYDRWFTFHTAMPPTNIGDSIFVITNDMDDVGGNDHNTANTWDARMFTRVLLPSSYTVQTISGTINSSGNFNNWYVQADGSSEIPSGGSNLADNWAASWAGRSVTWLKHTTGLTSEFFIVNQICNNTTYSSMSSVVSVTASGYAACLMNSNRFAAINKQSGFRSSGSATLSGTSGVIRFYITGLQNGVYMLSGGGNITVSNNVLYGTRNGDGTYVWTKQ